MVTVALFGKVGDWSEVRRHLMESNDLQQRTLQSRRTISREVVGRLAELDERELVELLDSGPQERGYLLWLAVCRRYSILGDFAEEVVRERYLLMTPHVSASDFDSFIRGKAVWHPEITELSEGTRAKLRQNAFRMLREAGLLSTRGEVLRATLSGGLLDLLSTRRSSDVRYFPTDQVGAHHGQ